MNIENNQISMIYSPEGQIATGFFFWQLYGSKLNYNGIEIS